MMNCNNLRTRPQIFGDTNSVFLYLLHAYRHSAQSTKQQPRVERMEYSSEQEECAVENLPHQLRVRDHCPCDNVTVPADVFSGRVDDYVDAAEDGLLEERRCPAV